MPELEGTIGVVNQPKNQIDKKKKWLQTASNSYEKLKCNSYGATDFSFYPWKRTQKNLKRFESSLIVSQHKQKTISKELVVENNLE